MFFFLFVFSSELNVFVDGVKVAMKVFNLIMFYNRKGVVHVATPYANRGDRRCHCCLFNIFHNYVGNDRGEAGSHRDSCYLFEHFSLRGKNKSFQGKDALLAGYIQLLIVGHYFLGIDFSSSSRCIAVPS